MTLLLSAILLAVMLCSAQAKAATINFSIRLGNLVPSGLGLTSGMIIPGTITYNGSLVPVSGPMTLTPVNDPGLRISFTLADEIFDQEHDTDPDFPALYFANSQLTGINFFANNHHPASDEYGFVQIESNLIGTAFIYSFDGFGEYTGEVTWPAPSSPVNPVPEPSTTLLLGLASFLCFRRKVRR